jgi:hypothetical protein
MRVKLFWELAGVAGRVTGFYLTKQRTELDWIRNGLRGWYLEPAGTPDSSSPRSDPDRESKGVKLALSYWVDAQRKYFEKAAERDHRKSKRLELQVHLLIWAALIVASFLTIVMFSSMGEIVFENEWLRGAPIIAIEFLLAAGALLHHYNERMAFSEQAKQYRRMQGIFDHASELINRTLQSKNLESARESLRNLGKEALAENGDWVLMHRERPLELPHP